MPEVGSHPGRGRYRRAARQADPSGSGLGLQFVGQSIQVTALFVVQETSHRGKKIERRAALCAKSARQ